MSAFTPSPLYETMKEDRSLISALLGGVSAMRAAGEVYLPREPREDAAAYAVRLARAYLYNATDRAIKAATGKIFGKAIIYDPAMPAEMLAWVEDCDLQGTHLDRFSREWFSDGLGMGVSFCFIDTNATAATGTLADQRANKLRPYLRIVSGQDVIGWRHDASGTITMVRIRETVLVEDGDYGEKLVEQVRILRPGSYEVIRKEPVPGKKDKFVESVVEAGTTGSSLIRVVPFYASEKDGIFLAKSPFANLAYANLRHWQSMSEQINILKVARVPVLVKKAAAVASDPSAGDDGARGNDDNEMVIGASTGFEIGVDEDIAWVEHNGAAINAGRTDLKDLEDAMDKASFSLTMRETSGDITATETAVSAAEAHGFLQGVALNFQDSLELVLMHMAQAGGLKVEPSVIVNKDFGVSRSSADMPLISAMRDAGTITRETEIAEAKRRGLLSEDVDAKKEVKAAEKEVKPTVAAPTVAPAIEASPPEFSTD